MLELRFLLQYIRSAGLEFKVGPTGKVRILKLTPSVSIASQIPLGRRDLLRVKRAAGG
jgi:hypothetical protein